MPSRDRPALSGLFVGLVAIGLVASPTIAGASGLLEDDTTVWMQTTKITPDDAAEPSPSGHPSSGFLTFGTAIALDGDTLVVSSTPDTGSHTDRVYVFEQDEDGAWVQAQRLDAPTEDAVDGFGFAVAVDATAGLLVVGNPGYDRHDANTAGDNDGIVHVYERSAAGTWDLSTSLVGRADRGDALGAEFGRSVAIGDGQIAIAAPFEDHPGKREAGAVYLFERDEGGWTQEARLVANAPQANAVFGGARNGLDLSDDTLAVGAPAERIEGGDGSGTGAVHVFEKNDGTWARTAHLPSPDPSQVDGPGGDSFGFSLALDADRLLIGDVGWDDLPASAAPWAGASNAGRAYVYHQEDEAWTLEATLKPDASLGGDWFGKYLDIEGDRAVVSAYKRAPQRMGATYVFERTEGAWEQQARLVPTETSPGDYIGRGLALDVDRVAVGAPFDDNRRDGTPPPLNDEGDIPGLGVDEGEDAGSVFIFEPRHQTMPGDGIDGRRLT